MLGLNELMKLNWLIWRKAQASKDLGNFYLKVLEKIYFEEVDERILEILGDVGG